MAMEDFVERQQQFAQDFAQQTGGIFQAVLEGAENLGRIAMESAGELIDRALGLLGLATGKGSSASTASGPSGPSAPTAAPPLSGITPAVTPVLSVQQSQTQAQNTVKELPENVQDMVRGMQTMVAQMLPQMVSSMQSVSPGDLSSFSPAQTPHMGIGRGQGVGVA